MVDRILFGWLAEKALSTVGETPCLVGWTPAFGSWRALVAQFPGPNMCLDKTAWDWTVQGWLVRFWVDWLDNIALEAPQWWKTAVRARMRCLFREAVFQFQDGFRIKQREWGLMKSGCFLTIILNSVSQVALHVIAQLNLGHDPLDGLPVAVGDDTLQRKLGHVDSYVQEIRRLGAIIKEISILPDIDFAGFRMSRSACVPAYKAKHLYRLEYSDHLAEYLVAMQSLYAYSDEMYQLFHHVAVKFAPSAAQSLRESRVLLDGKTIKGLAPLVENRAT